ncbi:MAG: TlpA family protein disulfide reductase [Bryobacterales bacterium]|nr:TlpA family protein disulfide reductase [Bryobacterales bacterium]MEB2363875.1 TlpA disulfide reductase family protein [Bryobacterales bacterium]
MEIAAGRLGAGSDTPKHTSASGAKSPPLAVPTIDGKIIQVHKEQGKVVLVDFMTTTCPSCKQASTGIQALYQELGQKGFLPVAVAIDPQAPSRLSFYRNLYGLTFPVGIVAREEVLRYLNHPDDKPMFVPTLVLLDRKGRISMKEVGWIGEQKLRSAVTGLLNQKTW